METQTKRFMDGVKKAAAGLKKIKAAAAKVGSAVAAVTKKFAMWGTAIAGVTAGIMSAGIKKSLDYIDNIAKMGRALDISTESLVAFDHLAQLSGSSIETMQKGLQIMTRRLGEAKAGYGEAAKGLKTLNIDVNDLVNMRADEQFVTIAEAIKQLPSAIDKTGAAYAIFGRQGVDLINVLEEGRAGFEAARKEVVATGQAFNEVGAAKAEALNDAMTRMKGVFSGMFTQLATRFAPVLEAVIESFNKWVSGKSNVTAFAKLLLGTGAKFYGWMKKAGAVFDLLIGYLNQFGINLKKIIGQALYDLSGVLGDAAGKKGARMVGEANLQWAEAQRRINAAKQTLGRNFEKEATDWIDKVNAEAEKKAIEATKKAEEKKKKLKEEARKKQQAADLDQIKKTGKAFIDFFSKAGKAVKKQTQKATQGVKDFWDFRTRKNTKLPSVVGGSVGILGSGKLSLSGLARNARLDAAADTAKQTKKIADNTARTNEILAGGVAAVAG